MKSKNAPDYAKTFWDKPETLPPEQMSNLFHRCLFNRAKGGAVKSTGNFSSGDPGFFPFGPIQSAIHQSILDNESLRQYHGTLPSTAIYKSFIPYFQDMGIKATKEDGLKPRNFVIGMGVTNLYAVMVKKIKEDYAQKYPSKEPVILMTSPTYGVYALQPLYNDVKVQTIPLSSKNNWKLKAKELRHVIDYIERDGKKKVVAFYNINPHNPTGQVYTSKELTPICDVFKKKDVFVIDDLIYRGSEFLHKKACPIASIDGMFDRSITLMGLGKAFCAADLRAGVACGRPEDTKYIHDFNYRHVLSIPIATQKALSSAFSMDSYTQKQRYNYLKQNADEYKYRLNILKAMVNGINSIDASDEEKELIQKTVRMGCNQSAKDSDKLLANGIEGLKLACTPESGYFALLDFSAYKGKYYGTTKIDTITKLCAVMIDDAGVLMLPSTLMLCGKENDMVTRCSFGLSADSIAKNIFHLKRELDKLTPEPKRGHQLEMPTGQQLSVNR